MRLGVCVFTCLLFCLLERGHSNPSRRRDDDSDFLEDRLKGNEANEHSHHEQFVGEEEADMFDQLPPLVAKKLLGKVVDKIDKDKDGFVSREELISWIEQLTHDKVHENSDLRWHRYNRGTPDKLSWEEYLTDSWGPDAVEGKGLQEIIDQDRGWTLKFVIERQKKRWEAADLDKDKYLSFNEFKSFIEPHSFRHMKEIVISESLNELDKNFDDQLSLEEYFDYVMRGKDEKEDGYKWQRQKYQEDFSQNRDLDKDGFLSKEEFGYWVFPENFHRPRSECNFLFQKADLNSDDRLSRKEIIDNHEVFVGSSATDFGEILKRKRDEL